MHTHVRRTHMKTAKRVLIGLLAVAMLVSSLLVYSFATEGEDAAPALPDYADVLKFYDPLYSAIYENENFDMLELGAYTGSAVSVADTAKGYTEINVKASGENKYLELAFGHILNSAALTDASYVTDLGEGELSMVVFKAAVSAAHSDIKGKVCASADCRYTTDNMAISLCPIHNTELKTVAAKAPKIVFNLVKSGVAAKLLTFDFATGKAYYSDISRGDIEIEGLTVTEGAWYNVELVANKTQYKFKITDGENTYETAEINSPSASFEAVSVGVNQVDDPRGASIMLDNIYVQAGIDDRHNGVDVLAKTKAGLTLIKTMLEDATLSAEVKNDVIAVYDTLIGDYSDKLVIDSESEEIMSGIKRAMLVFFREQLDVAVEAIDEDATYSARLLLVEDNKSFADRVRLLLQGETDEEAAEILAAYDAEVAALADLKANSEAFIAYMNGVMENNASVLTSTDYVALSAFVGETEDLFYADGEPIYSPSYPDAIDVNASYMAAATRYKTSLEKSIKFCEYVATAKLAEEDLNKPEAERVLTEDEFRAALAAYEQAVALNFDNDSYPGMADALADFSGFVKIESIAVVANRFKTNVSTADAAIYLFMKESWLDKAEPDFDAADVRYEGVKEAKELYATLRAYIAEKKAAADAYIAAVNNISGKTGDALIAAIDAALALRDAGNVAGYDGVTEANIALDNAHKSRQLELAYADKFIKLVNAIDEAETLEERFVAISAATAARGNALDTIDGVAAANQKLVVATSLYNSDISAANASYASVAERAADLSSAATSLTDIIKLVASAIKSVVG